MRAPFVLVKQAQDPSAKARNDSDRFFESVPRSGAHGRVSGLGVVTALNLA
jgi:hypothetical protein